MEDHQNHNSGEPFGSDRPITLSLIILVILLGVILVVGWVLARTGIDERPTPTQNRAEHSQQENGFDTTFYQNTQSQIQTPTSNPFEGTYENPFD